MARESPAELVCIRFVFSCSHAAIARVTGETGMSEVLPRERTPDEIKYHIHQGDDIIATRGRDPVVLMDRSEERGACEFMALAIGYMGAIDVAKPRCEAKIY